MQAAKETRTRALTTACRFIRQFDAGRPSSKTSNSTRFGERNCPARVDDRNGMTNR
jgi:hypothetical protein